MMKNRGRILNIIKLGLFLTFAWVLQNMKSRIITRIANATISRWDRVLPFCKANMNKNNQNEGFVLENSIYMITNDHFTSKINSQSINWKCYHWGHRNVHVSYIRWLYQLSVCLILSGQWIILPYIIVLYGSFNWLISRMVFLSSLRTSFRVIIFCGVMRIGLALPHLKEGTGYLLPPFSLSRGHPTHQKLQV